MAPKKYSYTEVVPLSGNTSVSVQSNAQTWTVQQITTECIIGGTIPPKSGAPVGATSRLRHNGDIISRMSAAGDVASGLPYVVILVGDTMTVEWTGCTPGAACKATLIFDDGT